MDSIFKNKYIKPGRNDKAEFVILCTIVDEDF